MNTEHDLTETLQQALAVDPDHLRRLELQLASAADAEHLVDIAYRTVDTPVGTLLLAATEIGLVRVAYATEDHDLVLQSLSDRISPRILHHPARLDAAAGELDEYFARRRRTFSVDLDWRLSAGFRATVLHHLSDIDYGHTASYATVAQLAGSPKAVRAVGECMCHQPASRHRAVPSRREIRRQHGWLPRRARSQGNPPWARGRRVTSIALRVDDLDWRGAVAGLDEVGISAAGPVLTLEECGELREIYDEAERFRSTIDMARHRFGEGQYRYFARPLPMIVAELRESFWPHLLPIARDWADRLRQPAQWPDDFDKWIAECHAAGQTRPTPLMLRYGPGDWNALHRDLYGDLVFPLQVVIGLDAPGDDYTGGEFIVVEQRPRAQSWATTCTIPQGHAVVFTTRDRPVRSARGWSAAPMRHGVSTLHSGRRQTLGLIFHDAK